MIRNMNTAIRFEMINNHFGEYPKKRSRKKAIIITSISGVLGFFGLHYFYLRKYWLGLFVLPAGWHVLVLLAAVSQSWWLAYPFLLGITGYFVYRYFKMPDEVFDQKYNHYQKCSACGRRLHLANKPTFGQGWLSDGSRICYPCFSIIRKQEDRIIGFNKTPFDADRSMEILEQALPFKKFLPSYFAMQKTGSQQKLEVLDDISQQILSIYYDIINDEQLLEQNMAVLPEDDPANYFKTCIVYDLGQVTKTLCGGALDLKKPETLAYVLVSVYLFSPRNLEFTEVAKSIFKATQSSKDFRAIFDPLKEIVEGGNPLPLKDMAGNCVEKSTEPTSGNVFSLPVTMKAVQSPLLENYVDLLNRFAESIFYDDGQSGAQQYAGLKQIRAAHLKPLNENLNPTWQYRHLKKIKCPYFAVCEPITPT